MQTHYFATGLINKSHIVSLKQQKQLANYKTQHDDLTGLIDRQAFNNKLTSLHADAQKHAGSYTMMVFDIADFSVIRKYYGQDVADELLRQLAPLARHCLREKDILSRWDNDRFAILLPSIHLDDAIRLGKRLQQRFARTRLLGLQTTLNLRIVNYHSDNTADDMIGHVQSAFHQMNSHGYQRITAQTWQSSL